MRIKCNLLQPAGLAFMGLMLALTFVVGERLAIFKWDLFLSGAILFATGIWIAAGLPAKLENTLDRLVTRGVLLTDADHLQRFKLSLEAEAAVWAKRSGFLVTIAMVIAFLVAGWSILWQPPEIFTMTSLAQFLPLTILEASWGYLVGWYLGYMALYGKLAVLLKQAGIEIKARYGHPDKVAGLEPIGYYYFVQAMVASIPALFLSAWLLINAIRPNPGYTAWQAAYLGLLPIAIAFEILAFFVPVWLFHREMRDQKKLLLAVADTLSYDIAELKGKLADLQNMADYETGKARIAEMTGRFQDIETMPTWPVAVGVRRRFALSNLALIAPVIIELLMDGSLWTVFRR